METTLPAPTDGRTTPVRAPWHALDVQQAVQALDVDPSAGLSAVEAAARRARYGPNTLTARRAEPRWRAFVRQYRDPMQVVLLVAGFVSLFLPDQLATGILLILLTLFNAVLGLDQEGKAEASVAALQKMLIVKTRVTRDGRLDEIDSAGLVPGDVVSLEAGDLVPADGRLLEAAALEIDESALTGESTPVAKSVATVAGTDTPLGDRTDMAYMNTDVTRGTARLLVTTTGMGTEVGRISGMLQTEATAQTPLTRQLNRLTSQILVIAGAALVLSIGLGLARGNPFSTLFLTAVAFAVAAIPTGLPAVVTAILAGGTSTLARSGAIVKRLRSVETLGATTAINSDKTGTLTLNQMTAVRMAVVGRQYTVTGHGYSTSGQIRHAAGGAPVPLEQYLLPMVLASDAVVSDGRLVGDPTEGALVVLAAKGGIDPDATRKAHPRIAEVPFDAAYKLMASFHRMRDEAGAEVVRCFVKGAPDQLLRRAATAHDPDGREVPVEEVRAAYLEANEALGREGLRVLATARKDFDARLFDPGSDLLGKLEGLTLLTLVGILDPPRAEAADAIARARAAGIEVRMITGDHAVTAQSIGARLGIEGRAITGAEFAAMSDQEALAQIGGIGVIARVAPEDKVRLVDILKQRGHVVAMTGDGVNDAPALKAADIGVAMGITGTEVSKEAAAMILTDDDFSTIVEAVEQGRSIYDNLTRYIRYQMGSLFGFILTFVGASLFNVLGGTPFLPLQTLWVNFTTNVFQAIGLGFGRPAPGLMDRPPRSANEPILPRGRLVHQLAMGLLMAVGTLGVIAGAQRAGAGEAVAHTMGLTTFSLFTMLYGLEAADERRSIFGTALLENPALLKTTGLSLLAIVLATELRVLQGILSTTGLDLGQWTTCAVVSLSVVAVAEVWKLFLRRRPAAEPQPAAGG